MMTDTAMHSSKEDVRFNDAKNLSVRAARSMHRSKSCKAVGKVLD